MTIPLLKGGWPGHSWLFETGAVLLHGPAAAQVAFGVGVVPLFDSDVGPRLPPQVFWGFGETSGLSAQSGTIHPRSFSVAAVAK